MNKSFTYNGQRYINGYACDSSGRPITIKNGYSSEDEKDARESYEDALIAMEKYKNQPNEKLETKIELNNHDLTAEEIEQLKNYRKYNQDGYLLNDAGEPISVENGYTDLDERYSKSVSKQIESGKLHY